jgi:hypothetical protein
MRAAFFAIPGPWSVSGTEPGIQRTTVRRRRALSNVGLDSGLSLREPRNDTRGN